MITMLSNSIIEQLNMNRRTGHIAMKVVSADSFCSVVWWGARAACAEVSTGSVEASKANLGFGSQMALRIHGRVIVSIHYHATHYRNNIALCDVQGISAISSVPLERYISQHFCTDVPVIPIV
jgi:hypothetical protein